MTRSIHHLITRRLATKGSRGSPFAPLARVDRTAEAPLNLHFRLACEATVNLVSTVSSLLLQGLLHFFPIVMVGGPTVILFHRL